eukprot:268971_1
MISKAIHRFLEDIDDRNSNKHKILTLITGYSRKHMCVGKVIYGDVVQLIGIYYGSWYNIFEIMLKKHPEILRENCHFETIDISAKRKRRKFSLSLKQIVMNSTNKTTFNCHVLVNVNSNITQELNNALNLFNKKIIRKQTNNFIFIMKNILEHLPKDVIVAIVVGVVKELPLLTTQEILGDFVIYIAVKQC